LAIVFIIVLAFASYKSLEQGRYALVNEWMTQQVNEEVLTDPGLKTVGPFNELLQYPSTYQTMYLVKDTRGVASNNQEEGECFDENDPSKDNCPMREIVVGAIRARSQDGLEMQVSASFQWTIEPIAIKPLYKILGHHLYKDEFVRFARAALVRACSDFPAEKFFTERQNITTKMQDFLISEFTKPEKGLTVIIQGLQLREVELPASFDTEIKKTQSEMQEVEVARAERDEKKILWQRNLDVSKKQVQEVLTDAEAQAQAISLQNEAAVFDVELYATKLAEANQKIIERFSGDPDPYERLFELLELRAIEAHGQAQTTIDM
jgi:regulator of protease activity HflC (stomatin/prohibitin superfamily)